MATVILVMLVPLLVLLLVPEPPVSPGIINKTQSAYDSLYGETHGPVQGNPHARISAYLDELRAHRLITAPKDEEMATNIVQKYFEQSALSEAEAAFEKEYIAKSLDEQRRHHNYYRIAVFFNMLYIGILAAYAIYTYRHTPA